MPGKFDDVARYIYGRIPKYTANNVSGTRLPIKGNTSAVSAQLPPGFYEVYGQTTTASGMLVFIADGASTTLSLAGCSTKSYLVPAEQSMVFEVREGVNDYLSGISRTGEGNYGTLCILKRNSLF